jgi:hypothetical protein
LIGLGVSSTAVDNFDEFCTGWRVREWAPNELDSNEIDGGALEVYAPVPSLADHFEIFPSSTGELDVTEAKVIAAHMAEGQSEESARMQQRPSTAVGNTPTKWSGVFVPLQRRRLGLRVRLVRMAD